MNRHDPSSARASRLEWPLMGTTTNPLSRIPCLYHFTDVRNLPLIRTLGGLQSTARLREQAQQFFPGGNQWSLEQDQRFGMDTYVHLCWATGHPMEWHIRQRDAAVRMIYLQIDTAILFEPNVRFSPGVANAVNMVTHSVQEAVDGNMIDYDAFYGNIGSLREAGPQARRQKAEKSEILVPDCVPIRFIRSLPNG
jgi:ssDNA thymidine ADP-ribosyltransferase, DarT